MKLINTNRFYLQGTPALHLATVTKGVREYVCFALNGKIYIEEISGGHLEFIEDDQLAEDLHNFLTEKRVLDATKPLLPDYLWLKGKPNENHT